MAVLIVAILALRNPKEASTPAGSDTHLTPSSARSGTSSKSAASKSSSTASSKSASTARRPGGGSSAATAIGSKPLIVLNDTKTPNLARDATSRFEGGGWKVTTYDENYSNDIMSTCAYYDPAVKGSKTASLALQKQYPTIKRVVARFPQLPAGPIVVILTADYSSS